MTKRKVLIWGGVGVCIYLLLMFFRDYCFVQEHCRKLWSSSAFFANVIGNGLFLFPFVFLLSLLTYKMKEEVFQAWWGFTRWFLPLSIFLILIMPGGQGGGFGVPSVFDREFLAFILAALFFLVSLGIIAVKWRKMRKG